MPQEDTTGPGTAGQNGEQAGLLATFSRSVLWRENLRTRVLGGVPALLAVLAQTVFAPLVLLAAVVDEDFAQKVEPHLLGLYYRNGFSVLPVVGEGHQFARDSLVRGAVASSRLLVTTREPIRIIFLDGADNVQIVYPQDGTEPRVFAIDENAVVAVRQSLLEQYLR